MQSAAGATTNYGFINIDNYVVTKVIQMKIYVKTEVRAYSIRDVSVSQINRDLTGEIDAIFDGITTYSGTVGELRKPILNEELIVNTPEYNLETNAELILEGAIESGSPLTLVDSKKNKIITQPVTYIKIEQ